MAAQQEDTDNFCETQPSTEAMTRAIADVPLIQAYEASRSAETDTTFVPIVFHVARNEDGSHPYPVPFEDFAQKMLDTLNKHFSVPALYFVQCGDIHYIDNSVVLDSLPKFFRLSYVSSALNLYIGGATNGGGGQGHFPASVELNAGFEGFNNVIWVKNTNPDRLIKVLLHEMGHSYGLFHTFEQASTYNNPVDPLSNPLSPIFLDHPYVVDESGDSTYATVHRELVIRDAALDESDVDFKLFNHHIAGDLVSDTHASCRSAKDQFPSSNNPPSCWDYNNISGSGCSHGCSYNTTTCTYDGDYLDYNGDPLHGNIIYNHMSYFRTCAKEFTAGQYGRISYYNYTERKSQYDFSLSPNLSDRIEFEDTNKPMQSVQMHFKHNNDERFTIAVADKDGHFQGMLYEDSVHIEMYKWGSNHVEETIYAPPYILFEQHFLPTNEDWTAGITSFDVLLISKHILGIQSLNGYRQLAADVNNSGTVTTADYIKVRKLLLGIDDEFEDLTSPWRFLPEYIPLNDSTAFHTDPFNMTFDGVAYTNDFPYLDTFPYVELDGLNGSSGFDGIKMGDVNGSYVNDICSPVDIPFYMPTVNKGAGVDIEIDIIPRNFQDIVAFQLAFSIDNAYLEFKDVATGDVYGLDKMRHFGLTKLDNNEMKIVWFADDFSTQTLSTGKPLFTLKFTSKQGISNLKNHFDLNDTVLKAAFYDANGCVQHVQLEGVIKSEPTLNLSASEANNQITSTRLSKKKEKVISTKEVHQLGKLNCFPNPTKGAKEIQVIFKSLIENKGTIVIHDALGRLLKTIPVDFHEGINEIKVITENLPKGLLLFTVHNKEGVFTQKVLNIN